MTARANPHYSGKTAIEKNASALEHHDPDSRYEKTIFPGFQTERTKENIVQHAKRQGYVNECF
jgi:hypothetical protein